MVRSGFISRAENHRASFFWYVFLPLVALCTNESQDVPRTPNQTNPRYSFDALSPARTDLSAPSPAVSSLAPSPEPYANQWAPLFSGRAVSGRTASSMNDRGPELDVINIGYQSRDSPVSAAPSSWDTHSRYASNGGISYVAYRPSA